jgi:colanic acid/amylovoran biosynthesis glycosyltransferase
MQFPAPSETFASNDIGELVSGGCRISVHALRAPHPMLAELTEQRRLTQVRMSHNRLGSSLRGLFLAITQPLLLAQVLLWLFSSSRGNTKHLLRSLALLPRAFDIVEEIGAAAPDVVHLYWGHYPSIVGFLVQRRMPEVITSISLSAYDLEMKFGGTALVAKRADALRTLARINVDEIAKLTGVRAEDIAIIPDGVDVSGAGLRAGTVEKVPFRIVTAGRLVPEKGIDDTIEILARIKTRWESASLVVLGDGPDTGRLQRLAEARGLSRDIIFLGHVEHHRVLEELGKAEVFLLMSRHSAERLPNVIKEGMACGVVCITTPTPGIEELLTDRDTGFLVPMRGVERAVGVIDGIFSRGDDRQRLIARARRHVAANFDLKLTSARYLALWGKARARRRSGPGTGEKAPWRRPVGSV